MKCDMNFSWCAALCSLFPSRLDRPCLAVDFVQCVVATTFQTSWSRLPSAKGLSVQCEPTARPGALISIKGNPVLRLSDRLKLQQIPGATYGGASPSRQVPKGVGAGKRFYGCVSLGGCLIII